MNRFYLITAAALAMVLAGCGSSVKSSTQAASNYTYTMYVTPDRVSINEGDYSTISATAEEQYLNGTPKAISPQPTIKFYSSDSRVSISAAGKVCAGQWDSTYLNCVATSTLPDGAVTITAYDAAHSTTGTTQVWVHRRAANITLCAPTSGTVATECSAASPSGSSYTNVVRTAQGYYPSGTNCVSQDNSVKYFAQAWDSSGNPLYSCSVSNTAGCVNDLDYTWSTTNSTVASAGEYGGVVALNPGVTTVYATLNGTVSTPVAFATCPPASITLASSGYTKGAATAPYSTADLTGLYKGSLTYLTAMTVVDTNGNSMPLVDTSGNALDSLDLTFNTSNRLAGAFTTVQPLTSLFTTTTSGHSTLSVSCTPTSCNPAVSDFVSPTGTTVTAKSAGYGYPIYSNLIGATVTGSTSSVILVTGTTFADGTTSAHELLTYDSESLALSHTISVPNTPNSLVVAPNGAKAYIGSAAGLVVVNLSTYQSSVQTYPISGALDTDYVTGKVLGVSPDSRYVIVSDTDNSEVFLVDTTGAEAYRYAIAGVRAATFASDMSNFWIAGDSGVYVYQGSSFVKTQYNTSANVTAMAWTMDGLSYFANGNALVNYSTCDDSNPQSVGTGPMNLDATAIGGVPRIFGYSTASNAWLDYSVTSSAQVGASSPKGNVCQATVTVNSPVSTTSTLACTPTQFSFSERLGREFVTGVSSSCTTSESVIHAYDLSTKAEINLTDTTAFVPLSGGVLTDGRELYVGSWDSTSLTAELHRFNLLDSSGDTGTLAEDITAISVPVVPSFVAVVPK
ncbi:MAG: hypothetical protein P4M01_02165 [Acidobacteriota bacterium]|nr:hypothetical protein [Acidobacteriota bacterium]